MNARQFNPWLHRFIVVTAVATFLLLGSGGMVTSHEAGMSVPDWPNTYGYNMFLFPVSKWIGGIFYEHTHRLWASMVGLMTTILALWVFGTKSRPLMRWAGFVLPLIGIASEILVPNRWLDGVLYGATGLVFYVASFFWPRCEPSAKWLRWLGVGAFLGVVAQGILGGLRVTLDMDKLGIVHGALAQSFFVLICLLALFTSRWWTVAAVCDRPLEGNATFKDRRYTSLRSLVLATTILIFLQLVLGATMRHQHAGLSIPDFPAAYGKVWPDTSAAAIARYNADRISVIAVNPITASQIILQMVHRIVALAIFICVTVCAWQAWRQFGRKDGLVRLAVFWLALIVCQIGLGAWTIWSNKAADVATAHVLGGALSLMTGALWCAAAFRPAVAALCERQPSERRSQTAATIGAHTALAGNK